MQYELPGTRPPHFLAFPHPLSARIAQVSTGRAALPSFLSHIGAADPTYVCQLYRQGGWDHLLRDCPLTTHWRRLASCSLPDGVEYTPATVTHFLPHAWYTLLDHTLLATRSTVTSLGQPHPPIRIQLVPWTPLSTSLLDWTPYMRRPLRNAPVREGPQSHLAALRQAPLSNAPFEFGDLPALPAVPHPAHWQPPSPLPTPRPSRRTRQTQRVGNAIILQVGLAPRCTLPSGHRDPAPQLVLNPPSRPPDGSLGTMP